MSTPLYATVILDGGLPQALDYEAGSFAEKLEIGMRVRVPLQKKSAIGTVIALSSHSSVKETKAILELLSESSLLPPDLLELALWLSKYYAAPLGRVFQSMLPPSVREAKMKEKKQLFIRPGVSLNELKAACERLRLSHPVQAKVLDELLKSPKGLLLSELLEKASVSQSPVKTLIKGKWLESIEMVLQRSPLLDQEFFSTKPKRLNEEQAACLEKIKETLLKEGFFTHLLHGVTGSGKTEVYLQAIEAAHKQNKGVIWLVPEIALTSQTIERVKGRFECPVEVLHHRLSEGQRHDAWKQIRSGKTKIVLGARSAIFSPMPNLGLIIVDEEHEPSYKQSDESPKYHARDVAVMRGKLAKATVILGSATPSLESYTNAIQGKYILSRLQVRADKAHLPQVTLVNMQPQFEKARGFTLFSEPLIEGIKKRLQEGEQTLLFLNRRGYHTSALCTSCAHMILCPHCDLSLTYHLGSEILACHLCDYRLKPPRECPACHTENSLKYKGAGTEMLERALHALFPEVRTLRLDADTTRHKGSHELYFKQFRAGKADVLIGTQMIAKGLHFPLVTLVGVIGLDGSLGIPDFRASETVFQLLTQVAGRAGRGQLKGEVIIQTHLPDHPIIQYAAAQDYEGFYAEEIAVRKQFHYPPFTHLIKLNFSGEDPSRCLEEAEKIRQKLICHLPASVEIHPIIPCGYAKIKGMSRFQCLIKTSSIGAVLPHLPLTINNGKRFRLSIDVDPLTTYF